MKLISLALIVSLFVPALATAQENSSAPQTEPAYPNKTPSEPTAPAVPSIEYPPLDQALAQPTPETVPVQQVQETVVAPPITKEVVAPPTPSQERYRFIGMSFDIGVPSGVALGVVGRVPKLSWLKLGVSATATVAPGIRGDITFDPIKFPIVPILGYSLGHQFQFSIPGVENSPDVQFSYMDFNVGLGFGSRDAFRFLLLSGASYVWGNASNIQGVIGSPIQGLTLGEPQFNGWLPNLKLGFQWLF